jgi:SOS-response transcriptional repressor LexA
MDERFQRLQQARLAKGFESAVAAADAFGWNQNTYRSNENGNAPFSYRRAKDYAAAFGVSPEWLYDAAGPMLPAAEAGYVPIIGRVGANPDGLVLYASGQEPGDLAPIPPGGSGQAVALRVVGHSMRGVADDGALIYFEDQRTPPTPDMLGHVVVVETDTDEVLVKRLLRGSRPGVFDLESIAGPTRSDARLRWAAHITAIIPPYQARRVICGAA